MGRFAIAAVAAIVLFALRWDSGLQHFDWQVWEASSKLMAEGADPYDAAVLNQELARDVAAYGPHFGPPREQYLLNPPTWITTVRFFGVSALALSFVSTLVWFGSVAVLSRRQELVDTAGHLAGAVFLAAMSPGASTFRFGQTGFWVAGLVALQLVVAGRRATGAPLGLLSSKPHMAFAIGLVELVRTPRRSATNAALPFAILVVVAGSTLGWATWRNWIVGIRAGSAHPQLDVRDMSLRTIIEDGPFLHMGNAGVVAGAVLAVGLAIGCRTAPPQVVTLAALALATWTSGHAFDHDWLWLPLVPVVFGLKAKTSFLASASLALILTVPPPAGWAVNLHSGVALGVTLLLITASIVGRTNGERAAVSSAERPDPVQARLSANDSS